MQMSTAGFMYPELVANFRQLLGSYLDNVEVNSHYSMSSAAPRFVTHVITLHIAIPDIACESSRDVCSRLVWDRLRVDSIVPVRLTSYTDVDSRFLRLHADYEVSDIEAFSDQIAREARCRFDKDIDRALSDILADE